MSAEWPLVSLNEAGISLIDCDHKTPKAQEQGYPYIGIPQLKDGRIVLDGARIISEADFEHWRRKAKPIPDDVILSRRCNPGESAYVPNGLEVALGQNLVLLRSNGDKVYPPFLRWLTKGPQWWSQVNQHRNVGAVFDSLKCADIPKFEIFLPSLVEQKSISKTLSDLDHKIQLNHQISQTLEQMAQALFKSWFVDFEPVKAKIAARERWQALQPENEPASPICYAAEFDEQPALGDLESYMNRAAMQTISGKTSEQLDALHVEDPKRYHELYETAALFPSAMQESELGEIPEGWECSTIGAEVEIKGGGTPPTKNKEYWEGGSINWTSPKDLSGAQTKVLISTERKITKAGLEKISSGLLPTDTVLMSSRAPVGYLALARIPVAINQGYIAMICKKRLQPEFVLQWAESVMDDIKQIASGSTFAEISKKSFRGVPIVVPAGNVAKIFCNIARAKYLSIELNLKNSNDLSEMRDALIPKLLSGELEV